MKLTGQCKQDFEKWYINKAWISNQNISTNYTERLGLYKMNNFEQLPPSMQYGILVDFFDSVEIFISIDAYISKKEIYFQYDINYITANKRFKTRQEAREQAITKANEVYNKKRDSKVIN